MDLLELSLVFFAPVLELTLAEIFRGLQILPHFVNLVLAKLQSGGLLKEIEIGFLQGVLQGLENRWWKGRLRRKFFSYRRSLGREEAGAFHKEKEPLGLAGQKSSCYFCEQECRQKSTTILCYLKQTDTTRITGSGAG